LRGQILEASKVDAAVQSKVFCVDESTGGDEQPAPFFNLLDQAAAALEGAAGKSDFSTTEHKAVVQEALAESGPGRAAVFAISVGDLSQDLDKPTCAVADHHFGDNALSTSLASAGESQRKISWMLGWPCLTENDQVKILHEFGQKLHIIQDFYSHSNYVEFKLKDNMNLWPDQLPL
jgi:hypothetical protein